MSLLFSESQLVGAAPAAARLRGLSEPQARDAARAYAGKAAPKSRGKERFARKRNTS